MASVDGCKQLLPRLRGALMQRKLAFRRSTLWSVVALRRIDQQFFRLVLINLKGGWWRQWWSLTSAVAAMIDPRMTQLRVTISGSGLTAEGSLFRGRDCHG